MNACIKVKVKLKLNKHKKMGYYQFDSTRINAYLSFSVNANNSASRFIRCSDKDRIGTDTIHVDACAGLNVIEMDVAILGNKINNVVFGGHLHGYGKVALRFGRKEDINLFLCVGLISSCRRADFDDMQLATSSGSYGKAEQIRQFCVSLCFKLRKRSRVSFNWLTNFTVNRVQLHCTSYAITLLEKGES